MALKGSALMLLWHDVQDEVEQDFHRWHTQEHMPERVTVPGFIRGRRYIGQGAKRHRYFTLYEIKDLAVLTSHDYLDMLNRPTPWSQKLQPYYYNFLRSGCDVLASHGDGVGGAMLTVRFDASAVKEEDIKKSAGTLTSEIGKLDGVTAVHVVIARPESTRDVTKETNLRGKDGDGLFGAAVLIEGLGRPFLEAQRKQIDNVFSKLGWKVSPENEEFYETAYLYEGGAH